MDMISCYDSDDDIATELLDKCDTNRHNNKNQPVDPKSPTKGASNAVNIIKKESYGVEEPLSNRVHTAYYKSDLIKSLQPQETTEPSTTKQETVVYNPDANSIVMSIELGSRDTASGYTFVTEDTNGLTRSKTKEVKTLQEKSIANFKKLSKEHTRNPENMILSSYAVDHPKYKDILSEKEIDCFGKVDNIGSVYINPSGVSERIYYSDISFQKELLHNDLCVAISNDNKLLELKKRRRLSPSEVESEDLFGAWIPFEEKLLPIAPVDADVPEEKEVKQDTKPKQSILILPSCTPETSVDLNEVSTIDGKQQTKFNGIVVSTFNKKVNTSHSWLAPSKNTKVEDLNSYKAALPKQEIFTYTGHTMAVQKILYFPRTGHYLLSASMDGFVKIWDSNNNRKCIRTYKGHSKGVRDINFANVNGTKFYSCSFDSNVVQWDTEYGKITGVYPIDKTPYCVTVDPNDESIFIVGGDNKKACQFDARSGEVVLEYTEHLGCVNTVTFIDDNRKIVTTGDDKKIVVWEYNIPVVVKHISTPSMHSMPAVVLHPTGKFVLAQSMDNQILVYESAGSRFKFYGGKRFKGHHNTGYAIKPVCSPDGKYVVSGDSRGRVFFWDWKSCKNLQTLTGHKSVTMDCKWHPTQSSRLATCSWDGTIKLWD